MGITKSMFLSREDVIKIVSTYKITEDEIGVFAKKILLDPKIVFNQIEKEKDERPVPLEEEVKNWTIKDLEKALNIKSDKNVIKNTKSKGIYFRKNVEDDISTFMTHWAGDFNKARELRLWLDMRIRDEIITQEYLRRTELKK